MRILQANSIFNGGGVDSQTIELSRGLAEAGHEVLLVVREGARLLATAQALPGVRVATLPSKRIAWTLGLARLASEFRAQILHAHHGRDFWTSVVAARLSSARPQVLVTRHLMTPLSKTSSKYLLRYADLAAVSKAVHAAVTPYLRGPENRVHLLFGGIDTDRFQPDESARRAMRARLGWDETAIGFGVIGSFHPPEGKGQLQFLEAAARVLPMCPRARFVIVGHGEMREQLEQRIAALGLREHAQILPFAHDVEHVDNALDVLVHPALGREAFGLVIIEAMACGKAIIASRLDGIPETFVDPQHGKLVAPGDIAALAHAMMVLAESPEARQRMGAAARAHVLAHAWTRSGYAHRSIALYEKICARDPLWRAAPAQSQR